MEILNTIFSALIMILLIGFLVFVHELGHFVAAKIVGAKVDKFGFGLPIGPTLYSKQIGETEFLVHAFLLGGYVSFPDDDEKNELPADSPLRFANKSVGQRAFVISAGVIMNVIVAYILIFLTGAIWHQLPSESYTTTFDSYLDGATKSAINADFKKGDIIYSINGLEAKYPSMLKRFVLLSREFDGKIDEKIANEKLEELKKLNPSFAKTGIIPAGKIVKLPKFTDEKSVEMTMDNILGLEQYKSTEIKLTENQKLLRDKIDYNKTFKTENETSLYDLSYAISDTKKPINIVVIRNNEKLSLSPIYPNKLASIGIKQEAKENFVEIISFKQLIKETIDYAYHTEKMMVYSLSKLFTGKIPASELNGIIAVTKIGTEIIANKGLAQGVLLAAMISLNLALMNVLPIPALDGGHLLFLAIEKITGKPPKKEFVDALSMFFFYLLIILMIFILFNDIRAWVIGKI